MRGTKTIASALITIALLMSMVAPAAATQADITANSVDITNDASLSSAMMAEEDEKEDETEDGEDGEDGTEDGEDGTEDGTGEEEENPYSGTLLGDVVEIVNSV